MTEDNKITRRWLLGATGGAAAGLAVTGTAAACDDHDDHEEMDCHYEVIGHDHDHGEGEHGEGEHPDPVHEFLLCPDHPHAGDVTGHTMHHVNATMAACPSGTGLDVCPELDPDDPDMDAIDEQWPDCTNWPEPTKEIVKESREALTSTYNDVGTLLARGYIPYFDVVTPGFDGGVSHWLNPEYIADSQLEPNPQRPDALVLDNNTFRPLGPMYIATKEGDVVWDDEEEEIMEAREAWGYESDCGRCDPFHPHNGMAGRFAWWYYRQVHEADYASGDPDDVMLPCYTAPMMHSWIYPTPDGPHGDTGGAPPMEYRPDEPVVVPSFLSEIELPLPGEDELSLDVLPGLVRETAMPERLERELGIIDDLPQETLANTPVGELEEIMDDELGPVGETLNTIGTLELDGLDSALGAAVGSGSPLDLGGLL